MLCSHKVVGSYQNKISLLVLSIAFIGQQVYAAPGYTGNNLPPSGNFQGTGSYGHGIELNVDSTTQASSEIDAASTATGGINSVWDTGNGLQVNGDYNQLTSITNNGTLQGGSDSIANNLGGRGVNIESLELDKFINNGHIIGGKGVYGGDALYFTDSQVKEVVNNGTIKGGERGSQSGSALVVDAGSEVTIYNHKLIAGGDSTVSGAGGGNGIYLSNDNGTGSKATIYNEGTIIAGNNGAAAIYTTADTTVNIINSGLISKGGGKNALELGSSGNTIELQTGGQFEGNLEAKEKNQFFIFNANKSSGSNTFNLSTLKGYGWLNDGTPMNSRTLFAKEGQYDWILTGEFNLGGVWFNTSQWEVNGGNLVVGGQVSDNTLLRGAIDINSGATLSGFGTVTGIVNVNGGGTVTAGYNSVGTIRVGQINFAANSTYLVDASSAGTDLIIVDKSLSNIGAGSSGIGAGDGKAYITSGAKVYVQADKGWKAGDYKILQTQKANDVEGQFDGVSSNLAFLDATVENRNSNQEVWLTLVRNGTSFTDIAVTRNQRQTSKGLESLGANSLLKNEIVGLSAVSALNAYDSLSGEIHASVQAALLNDRYVRDAINEHLIDRFETQGTGLWVTSWGATENLGSDNNAAKVSNNVFGFMVGADNNLDETTKAGIALGYQHNNINLNKGRHSDAEIDSYHLAAYLGKEFAYDISLRGGLDYAYLNIRTDRNIEVGRIRDSNKDSYHGNLVQGFVELSKGIKVADSVKVEPYLNVAHVYMDAKFNEGSSVTALKGSGENQVTFSTAGLRTKINLADKVKLNIGAGWQHAYGNRNADTDMKFNGGSYFNINGVPITKDATIAEVGLEVSLTPNTSISANYQGQFGNKVENNAVKVGLNYKF